MFVDVSDLIRQVSGGLKKTLGVWARYNVFICYWRGSDTFQDVPITLISSLQNVPAGRARDITGCIDWQRCTCGFYKDHLAATYPDLPVVSAARTRATAKPRLHPWGSQQCASDSRGASDEEIPVTPSLTTHNTPRPTNILLGTDAIQPCRHQLHVCRLENSHISTARKSLSLLPGHELELSGQLRIIHSGFFLVCAGSESCYCLLKTQNFMKISTQIVKNS